MFEVVKASLSWCLTSSPALQRQMFRTLSAIAYLHSAPRHLGKDQQIERREGMKAPKEECSTQGPRVHGIK